MNENKESNTTPNKTNEGLDVLPESLNTQELDSDVLKIQIPSISKVNHNQIQIFKDLYLLNTPQDKIAEQLGVHPTTISKWYILRNSFMYKFVESLRYKRLLKIAERSLEQITIDGEEKNRLTASLAIIDRLGGEEWNKKEEEKGEIKINFGFNVQGNVNIVPPTVE